ncbi:hypothetical protein TEQG_07925 [Trichophyton equinum CBS 127.97]|uniref:Uncharacterized protein n=1 Tax=Trichophyton equinum (strain ATCC MYA-4606 / CBS 127.97) TaxID=559882 RepID=F2Q4E4_TRIEC|nr:hypothetical protein TEQG_07925 [Trichophyton equinum CBS 127.97]
MPKLNIAHLSRLGPRTSDLAAFVGKVKVKVKVPGIVLACPRKPQECLGCSARALGVQQQPNCLTKPQGRLGLENAAASLDAGGGRAWRRSVGVGITTQVRVALHLAERGQQGARVAIYSLAF